MSDKVKCEKCHLTVDHTMWHNSKKLCAHCFTECQYGTGRIEPEEPQSEEDWRGLVIAPGKMFRFVHGNRHVETSIPSQTT